MEEIKIDKKGAKKFNLVGFGISELIAFIIWQVIDFVMSRIMFAYTTPPKIGVYFFLIGSAFAVYGFARRWRVISTLQYFVDMENHKLVEIYKVIGKKTHQARLQVVNSVDISQDWKDRIFRLFTVEVDYGFAQTGYTFYFHFMPEEVANELADKIRTSGSPVHIK